MAKFTFIYDNTDGYVDSRKVTFEVGDNLPVHHMLDQFQAFLSASGYFFSEGDHFDVVNDREDEARYNGTSEKDFDHVSFVERDGDEDTWTPSNRSKYDFSDDEIGNEIARLREVQPMLSEEAYEMIAWQNLSERKDAEENNNAS